MLEKIFDAEAFDAALGTSDNPLPLFKDILKTSAEKLIELYKRGTAIEDLVTLRSELIDIILIRSWNMKLPSDANAALIAVGGYGRGELHPASDIDLLILLGDNDPDTSLNEGLSDLLTFFWDIGLEVGHSVRTRAECISEAEQDITVATNLMESRLLVGPVSMLLDLKETTGPEHIWPSDLFFRAKWEEQKKRYRKYDDTISNLEPNLKEGPGGLRDIQMIGWVVKRHFGAVTMDDLVSEGFLTPDEFQDLMDDQSLLWRIRFALHTLTGRREDRMLFDYQRTLAEQFGYEDDAQELGVEKFMQNYYRTALRISRMNEMLLQLFQEVILLKRHLDPPTPINSHFQSRSGFLEVTREDTFIQHPLALLEMFLIMAQHPELNGVRASTARLARKHRDLINDDIRQDDRARTLFMDLLRQPEGVTQEMRRMNRYGILARYIPAFANIVGRMQYDLFHVFTVDEHTLFVLRNIRRFTVPEYRGEFPLCSDISDHLPKQEILYLAALFHDIAKGRGGDHSKLGAVDALEFCLQHNLSGHDSRLISWLVGNHLLMSMTAQRKDISDPEVIQKFASEVESINRLNNLYLLTVADMRATDPKKWNNWKNSLLRDLYNATKAALLRGLHNPQEADELIQNKQAGALHWLVNDGFDETAVKQHWQLLNLNYFQHHTWEEIAWQTKMALSASSEKLPLILIRKAPTRGGSEVFIFAPDQERLFALTTGALDQLALNIVEANIETADNGYTLNSFMVLENDGSPVEELDRREEIQRNLRKALATPQTTDSSVSRRLPRQMKHFSTATRIDFVQDRTNQRTILKLLTDDRPGLLSQVGEAFIECGIQLINAKIATIGAEAEDTFFITDSEHAPLTRREQFDCIKKAIYNRLNND